eukprot:scaffold74894_cov34-Phaeocystis_antarctica.AAC.2
MWSKVSKATWQVYSPVSASWPAIAPGLKEPPVRAQRSHIGRTPKPLTTMPVANRSTREIMSTSL